MWNLEKAINIMNNSRNPKSIKLQYTNVYKKITSGKYKYILLTSIMDCIQTIISLWFLFFLTLYL